MTASILTSRPGTRSRGADTMTRSPRQAVVHLTVTVVRHLLFASTGPADWGEAW